MPDRAATVSDLHPSRGAGPAAALNAFARQTCGALRTFDFEIDLLERCARYPDGEEVRFTPHQWRLLEALVAVAPEPVTCRSLVEHVFEPGDRKGEEDVALLVTQLRRKLDPDPGVPRYFRAAGLDGYAFHPYGGVQP